MDIPSTAKGWVFILALPFALITLIYASSTQVALVGLAFIGLAALVLYYVVYHIDRVLKEGF